MLLSHTVSNKKTHQKGDIPLPPRRETGVRAPEDCLDPTPAPLAAGEGTVRPPPPLEVDPARWAKLAAVAKEKQFNGSVQLDTVYLV